MYLAEIYPIILYMLDFIFLLIKCNCPSNTWAAFLFLTRLSSLSSHTDDNPRPLYGHNIRTRSLLHLSFPALSFEDLTPFYHRSFTSKSNTTVNSQFLSTISSHFENTERLEGTTIYLIDWLIDSTDISTLRGLFYTYWSRNCVHRASIFTVL